MLQRRGPPDGAAHRLLFVGLLAFASLFWGCGAKRPKGFDSRAALQVFSQQRAGVRSVRGTAWTTVATRQGGGSFHAPVAFTMDPPGAGTALRVEGNDPLGVTHVLILMAPDAASEREPGELVLTWVDFDAKTYYQVRGSWQGIPLEQLPMVLLGFAPVPDDGVVSRADEDSFDIRRGELLTQRYLLSWIDPGPRPALERFELRVHAPPGAETVKYWAGFKVFGDSHDHYLPRDVELGGASGLSVKLSWRHRFYNDAIEPAVFRLPDGLLPKLKRMKAPESF